MRSVVTAVAAVGCLSTLVACAGPPSETVGSGIAMQVVLDTAVFEASAVFQVHVLKATTKGGGTLTCSDIPGTYRIGVPQLEELVPAQTAQKDANDPTKAVALVLRVPSEQDMVIVARGLAPYKGTFVVGRGCRDNLNFEEGSKVKIDIDVRATTGSRCTKPADCEPNVTCLQGPGFEEGYCAVTQCSTGTKCPPGSACISDAAMGGLCMRLCKSISDCEIVAKGQDCQGRLSLSSQGCDRVCVYPLWQQANCCPPSACGASDGGV